MEQAFAAYLRADGWDVSLNNRDYVDLLATRGSEVIVAELKGHTSSPGLDVDTGYGQSLRRIDPHRRRECATRWSCLPACGFT